MTEQERLAALERDVVNSMKLLKEMVKYSEKVSVAIDRLENHHEIILKSQDKINDHETRIKLTENHLARIGEKPQENSFTNKVVVWVAASLVGGAIVYVFNNLG